MLYEEQNKEIHGNEKQQRSVIVNLENKSFLVLVGGLVKEQKLSQLNELLYNTKSLGQRSPDEIGIILSPTKSTTINTLNLLKS